jgi:hypothetical protein
MRAIRFKSTERRAMFINNLFKNSEFNTVKRACIDCWRHWKDRPSFLSAINNFDTSHPEMQRMLWLTSMNFDDEGKHFRLRVQKKIDSSWELGIETQASKKFSTLYKKWVNECDF